MGLRPAVIAIAPLLSLATSVRAHHGQTERTPSSDVVAPLDLAPAARAAARAAGTLLPVAMVLGTVFIGPGRRRAGALAGLVLVFAFEGAIHSVHHLGDPQGQVRCAIESASSNLTGVPSGPFDLASLDVGRSIASSPHIGPPSVEIPHAEQPRAPPVLA